MAREAEYRTIIDDSIDTSIGYDKKKLWAACHDIWTKEWKQDTTCRMSKIFYPHPDKNKTKKLLQHGRTYMRRIIECTTGHNTLYYLEGKIYPEDVPELCRFCEEEKETFGHLATQRMPMLPTSSLRHTTQSTNYKHYKMGLCRHNIILTHTNH